MYDLQSRLEDLWHNSLGGAGPSPYEDLERRYSEPHRAYHTLDHIRSCLEEADLVCADYRVILALWYHDAVYDPRKSDNEERSADLIRALPIHRSDAERAAELVMVTKHNVAPQDGDGEVTSDIDLAILGQPEKGFDLYERQIREEYAWVPEPAFREKRVEILKAFLGRPKIYWTPYFHYKYEKSARANIARSLAKLEGKV